MAVPETGENGAPPYIAFLKDKVANAPTRPGVYLMKNASGTVIYVGKATSLRNRLRQYFQSDRKHPPKVRAMVAEIRDFEYIVTGSEVEALILEANLIKEQAPWYNIRLKDDKGYPFVKVSLEEDFPRVHIARRVKRDGGRYFGPYTDVSALRETLALIKRVYPIRSCKTPIIPGDKARRPCLNYHIQRCLGPCVGNVGADRYRTMIEEVCLLLEGRHDKIVPGLQARMEEAAQRLDFESAARYRDQIRALSKVVEKQKIVSDAYSDFDLLYVAVSDRRDLGCGQVFFVRGGKLVGREHFFLEEVEERPLAESLAAFLQQYYLEASFVPREVLLPITIPDAALVEEWLSTKRGGKVRLFTPQRGDKAHLLAMVGENARTFLDEEIRRLELAAERDEGAGLQLAEALGLPAPPMRIECYDISNTQGTLAVGSMVVFEAGKPKRSDYRRFRIKTVEGANDFAMLAEVIRRRFTHGSQGDASEADRFAHHPDLLLIDGGKGQLHSVRDELRRLNLEDIPAAGLAKQFEYLFIEDRSEPIILLPNSPALFLVQRIRDEAHRFAIGYHRQLRDARTQRSALDEIPGIGPKRKKELIKTFGSVRGIRSATCAEVAAVPGIGPQLAQQIKDALGTARGTSR